MELIHSFVSAHNVLISAGLLILAYIFIATEKIPKVTIALLGAGITIFLGLVSQTRVLDGVLNPTYFVQYIDFNVIFLLVSMMIIVNITTRSGVFSYLANELLKMTKGHPVLILIALGIFTAVVSAFLDNVTTVILIMPITFAIARKLEIDPIPYLLTEVFASNIGGTATLIGDPPNIIIGSAAGFSFMDFVNNLTLVVAVILIAVLAVMVLFFRKKLATTAEKMKEAANIDNTHTITDVPLMVRSMIVLALVILGFVTHDITHIETCVAAMLGASFLLLFEKPTDILRDVEWNTIFFFIGLFVMVYGLEVTGILSYLGHEFIEMTNGSINKLIYLILWSSAILSSIIDNIPFVATMIPMLKSMEPSLGGREAMMPVWWALSLGACFGGNGTLIGASANVVVAGLAMREGHPINFMKFLLWSIPVMLLSVLIASAALYLEYIM